jgi:hypothetical protein
MQDYKPTAYQDISKLKKFGFKSPLLAMAEAKGLLPMSSFASTPEGAAAAAPPFNPNMGAMNPNNPVWDPFGVTASNAPAASSNPVWDPFGVNSWKKSGGYATGGDINSQDPMNPMGGAPASQFGLAGLMHGGTAKDKPIEGYLDGPGDGMSDSIVATIDGHQPARLADGEFVIPADVVSHLGNGSSKAGAKVLYAMMDRIRESRTGNPKQGKEIKPNKFLPA